ncbi:ferrous iron transport protein B [Pseudemcibacter aquimaris]|uniref:ferrous iron transport protein B n=1 Tax=Pseudemcibacter aquimaris TaxID=2857064 RepID=UPI002011042A|nr:ferrous iron transport protein B [Pseudemcibacter aquimaris]MCC3861600.1 ferrous iron transport protein B [Pseudemcibacter aquimaris]WDU58369.1 ferrous iron transport protein B [Pseudemcibacter aquimaris]
MTNLNVALIGAPNSGKSSLFNTMTGSHQKVANYPGVTVERRSGEVDTEGGHKIKLIDLPGIYSLNDRSLDEKVSREVLTGEHAFEKQPDVLVCVINASNIRVHLRLVLELKSLGLPMIVALNMHDLATRDGIEIDTARLSEELGMPVFTTVAVRKSGIARLVEYLNRDADAYEKPTGSVTDTSTRALQKEAGRISKVATVKEGGHHKMTRALDKVLLNPVLGPLVFFAMLFFMFQAVFSWAGAPMDMIEEVFGVIGEAVGENIPPGIFQSFIQDGLIAGVGSVLVFLPQIIILFTFILILEASGYMARAAFIMDKLMAKVGLNGRAFIPLLSSFACAIPGIMATRTIANHRDRITTIMIAPLMTCSARLPVYTLLIAAFIPNDTVMGYFGLQGVVFFCLYLAGIVSAIIVAAVMKKTITKGTLQPFLMELPKYQLPRFSHVFLELWQRVRAFLRRAGTIILYAAIALWALTLYPKAPENATEADIYYSFAGLIGRGLQTIFAPLGFNWEISIALVPGMAAREVAVSALGTVYALQGDEEQVAESLATVLQSAWPLSTALAFLVWFIYAPQCLATLATARRETNSWGWTAFMTGYLFGLAYLMSLIVNIAAKALMA